MNSKIIPSDIEINENIVTKLLYDQFYISVKTIVLLGEGWDNTVYLINDHLVFRFPRRLEAVQLVEREMLILPKLKGLALAIPHPLYFGRPSKLFPRPFYGHELIKGRSGCNVSLSTKEYEQVAIDLAQFLKRLHCLDTKDMGLDNERMDPAFDRADSEKMLAKFDDRLLQVKRNYDLKDHLVKLSDIRTHAFGYSQKNSRMVFVHGDFYHRHLIFDDHNCLTGIIDWGDCCIGDAVADLGVVFQFLPKCVHKIFFTEYGHVEQDVLHYARFLGLYYAIVLLWFGHDRQDKDLIRTSLSTLAEI